MCTYLFIHRYVVGIGEPWDMILTHNMMLLTMKYNLSFYYLGSCMICFGGDVYVHRSRGL